MKTLILALAATSASASYDAITGYAPQTDVSTHAMVDLDMDEISTAAGSYDFTQAMFVYNNGGNGLCSSTDIATTDTTDSCYGHTTSDAKGNSVKGSGSIRTLAGFATSGASKMSAEKYWNLYKNYWGDDNYADTFVTAAAASSTMQDSMIAELIKKGIAYQADWMYVLHEFEDAVFDCLAGNIYDNDMTTAGDAPYAWDEGVAFYSGSLEGTAEGGDSSGEMLYRLAQKRCADYGTCVADDGSMTTDNSKVALANKKFIEYAELGRDAILQYKCNTVDDEFQAMVDQMTIPLLQGMLKYAFKADPRNPSGSCTDTSTSSCHKSWGEGWAFAAAVLPRINYCSASVASMVSENLNVSTTNPMSQVGFEYFKTKVEQTYACLGITCEEIGEYQSTSGVYPGMEACRDSYDIIAGYTPATDVSPHAMVDLDMDEISTAAGSYDFTQAMFVYNSGGGGLCSTDDIATTDTADSCYGHTTSDAKGNSVKGSGSVRTLAGFATSGASKMSAETWWPVYKNYWGDDNYADTFVTAAAASTTMQDAMKAELVKKGVAYQANWMYVLHEFEDAIADCLAGDIYNNDAISSAGDSPHAWDEGWAFYAGSLEGENGDSQGEMLYRLAQKRCADFGTCTGGTSGVALANANALAYATTGKGEILLYDCAGAETTFHLIVPQMTIPLVQGMLKYAFKSDPTNPSGSCTDPTSSGCAKAWGEGWAFAAAILPQINQCSSSTAAMVVSALDVANAEPMSNTGYAAFKTEIENCYAAMGITCADVGEYQSTSGVYSGMEACDVTPAEVMPGSKSSSTKVDLVPVIILVVVAVLLAVVAVVLYVKWNKAETKLYELVANSGDKNNML